MGRAKKKSRTARQSAVTGGGSGPSVPLSFGLLPDELLLLVLHLVDVRDLARLACVDRRLSRLARDADLWQRHVSEIFSKPIDQLWKPKALSWRDCWLRWGRAPHLTSAEAPSPLGCSRACYVTLDRFLFVLAFNVLKRFEPKGITRWWCSRQVELEDCKNSAQQQFYDLEACGDRQLVTYGYCWVFGRIVVVLDKDLLTLARSPLDVGLGVVPSAERLLVYHEDTAHLSWLNRDDLSFVPASSALPAVASSSPLLACGIDRFACFVDGCPRNYTGWRPSCDTESLRSSNAPFDLYRFGRDAEVMSVEPVRVEVPAGARVACCLRAIDDRLLLVTTTSLPSDTTFFERVIAGVEVRSLEPSGLRLVRVALDIGTEARSTCECQTANGLLYVLLGAEPTKANTVAPPPLLLHCLNADAKLIWTTSFSVGPALYSCLPLSNGQIVVHSGPRQRARPRLLATGPA